MDPPPTLRNHVFSTENNQKLAFSDPPPPLQVVVFPQAPFRVTNVPGQASAGIIQLRNCTMAFLRTALGDLVTPFVLESCLIIHVLLNLQVHTWGMSLASSGKFV